MSFIDRSPWLVRYWIDSVVDLKMDRRHGAYKNGRDRVPPIITGYLQMQPRPMPAHFPEVKIIRTDEFFHPENEFPPEPGNFHYKMSKTGVSSVASFFIGNDATRMQFFLDIMPRTRGKWMTQLPSDLEMMDRSLPGKVAETGWNIPDRVARDDLVVEWIDSNKQPLFKAKRGGDAISPSRPIVEFIKYAALKPGFINRENVIKIIKDAFDAVFLQYMTANEKEKEKSGDVKEYKDYAATARYDAVNAVVTSRRSTGTATIREIDDHVIDRVAEFESTTDPTTSTTFEESVIGSRTPPSGSRYDKNDIYFINTMIQKSQNHRQMEDIVADAAVVKMHENMLANDWARNTWYSPVELVRESIRGMFNRSKLSEKPGSPFHSKNVPIDCNELSAIITAISGTSPGERYGERYNDEYLRKARQRLKYRTDNELCGEGKRREKKATGW
jgi:hypothetical protein